MCAYSKAAEHGQSRRNVGACRCSLLWRKFSPLDQHADELKYLSRRYIRGHYSAEQPRACVARPGPPTSCIRCLDPYQNPRLKLNSKGLVGASFWVYARQDIAMALVHECPTMLPPEEWYVSYAEQETADDRLGNQIIWCLARVIAFTFGLAGILLPAKVPGIQLIIYEKNQDFV